MKYLLAAFILLFAANAFASKPDSGICPWKIPFTIIVRATGTNKGQGTFFMDEHNEHYPVRDTIIPISKDSTLFYIVVDSTSDACITYSLSNDELFFSRRHGTINCNGYPEDESLHIIFYPGKDSIILMSYSRSDYSTGSIGATSYYFQISYLSFNDSSIYSDDLSSLEHQVSLTIDGYDTLRDLVVNGEVGEEDENSNFTASSVTLSGLFRTTTYSDPSAAVAVPMQNTLSIFNSNGSIACSFEKSENERDLEIYSPLGIRIASVTIPAEESPVSLPHLAAGIYFVRLEGDVRKVCIPN